MICILAMVVFGFLGIFSTSHRIIAKEAFDCVFRRVTLRKCESGLDKRLKNQITGKLMKKRPAIAKFTYRHFEIISWIFTIIFIISLTYTAIGGVNYYIYGNCNGPNQDGFCIFNPSGSNSKISEVDNKLESCSSIEKEPALLTRDGLNLSTFPNLNKNGKNNILFIGCYSCEYTRKSFSIINKLIKNENNNFIFGHLPVKDGDNFVTNVVNCVYKEDENKFIEVNNAFLQLEIEKLKDKNEILKIIEDAGMNRNKIESCAESNESYELTNNQMNELKKTNVYGTPTVFINEKAVVGPKPYRVYKRLFK